jgi:hypothetical protein
MKGVGEAAAGARVEAGMRIVHGPVVGVFAADAAQPLPDPLRHHDEDSPSRPATGTVTATNASTTTRTVPVVQRLARSLRPATAPGRRQSQSSCDWHCHCDQQQHHNSPSRPATGTVTATNNTTLVPIGARHCCERRPSSATMARDS